MLEKKGYIEFLIEVVERIDAFMGSLQSTSLIKVACVGDSTTFGDGSRDYVQKYLFWIKSVIFSDYFSDSYPS